MGIVIQARIGSVRLPRKVLFLLPTGETVLERVVGQALDTDIPVVVVTPDVEIVNECERLGVRAYLSITEGRDVHAEILNAALSEGYCHIIRLTADCPLITTDDIIHAVTSYRGHYIYHGPDGRDVEIFPTEQFKQLAPDNDSPTAGFHHNGLSLDTQDDYNQICRQLKK